MSVFEEQLLPEQTFSAPAYDPVSGVKTVVNLTASLHALSPEAALFATLTNEQLKSTEETLSAFYESFSALITERLVNLLGYKYSINTQSGVSYTLGLGDVGALVRMTSDSVNNVIVPSNVNVPFEIGTILNIRQAGDGLTSVAPFAGVVINTPVNSYASTGKFGTLSLVKVAEDEWDLVRSFIGVPISEIQLLENRIAALEQA